MLFFKQLVGMDTDEFTLDDSEEIPISSYKVLVPAGSV
jgi:hypothetical protein